MSACPANDNGSIGPNIILDTCSILTESENGESVSGISSAPPVDQATVAEDPPEILGSVVQSQELENGDKNSSVQLRTSARVSKKMRLDVIANQTPPERKDVPKEEDKLDTKPKRRPFELWPQEDKNIFFEALNEFGKDFDAIQRYFEAKAKRKNLPEHTVKNKEQIRHFYYRTWHKISKHLRFPEEVKKATQELYGLINFGELRKKIGSVSEKTSLRLNELIYRGFTTIRVRGKGIRVKTPICRALRKLNQQEDLAQDLKLPTRVTVELRPRTNDAWARVQATAQNPRVQTLLPLQRRLSSLLSFLEQRWQPHSLKHCEQLQSQLDEVTAKMESINESLMTNTNVNVDAGPSNLLVLNDGKRGNTDTSNMPGLSIKNDSQKQYVLRFAPKSDSTIMPITINLSEYFTSSRLSLNSHEGRLGNHGAEQLFNSMLHATKGCGRRGTKRQRNDSSSEKKKEQQLSQLQLDSSPEKSKDGSQSGIFTPTENEDVKPSCAFRLFGSGINLDASSAHSDKANGDAGTAGTSKMMPTKEDINNVPSGGSSLDNGHGNGNQQSSVLRSPAAESNEEIIKRVRAGWTKDNANAVTIGELYLMFGADSKLKMEYWWEERQDIASKEVSSATLTEVKSQQDLSNSPPQKAPNNELSIALQKLLSISKMYSSQSKCACGHVCNGTPKSTLPKAKVSRPLRVTADVDKIIKTDIPLEIPNGIGKISSPTTNDGPFRRPLMPSPHFKPPPRPGTADAFKAQLDKFRPRGCNRRGRPVSVKKNVVVPRMLPLLPKAPQASSVVTFQVMNQNTPMMGDFIPIAQSPSILNFTPTSSPNMLQTPMPQFVHKVSEAPTIQSSSSKTTMSSASKPNSSAVDVGISMPNLCDEKPSDQVTAPDQSIVNKAESQTQSCHLVRDLFPPTLDTPVNSPPSISNLLDLSLPSELGLTSSPMMETNFSGLLSSSGVSSPPPPSPATMLKEDENQWLNAEDFSLSSFLGHLESPMKTTSESLQGNNEQTSIASDVETHMQCLMAENSFDYVAKFADLAAQMASDGGGKS